MDRGDWWAKKKENICVYIYLKMDCQCLNRMRERERSEGERKTERKGHSVGSDQRGYFVQGNCSVLLS